MKREESLDCRSSFKYIILIISKTTFPVRLLFHLTFADCCCSVFILTTTHHQKQQVNFRSEFTILATTYLFVLPRLHFCFPETIRLKRVIINWFSSWSRKRPCFQPGKSIVNTANYGVNHLINTKMLMSARIMQCNAVSTINEAKVNLLKDLLLTENKKAQKSTGNKGIRMLNLTNQTFFSQWRR